SATSLRTSGAYVRSGFHYSCFTPSWYRVHTAAWVAPRWRVPNIWAVPAWTSVAGWCGITAEPIVYDYGSTTVINNNNVYVDGNKPATAEQYSDQASAMVERGRKAETDKTEEWQPLGVFGLIQGDEKVAQNIFQLAINKAGIVRGNYYDAIADNTIAVTVALTPQTPHVPPSLP